MLKMSVVHQNVTSGGVRAFNQWSVLSYDWINKWPMLTIDHYRSDFEKREQCELVAQERLTEPRFIMEWLWALPMSFFKFLRFLDLKVYTCNSNCIKTVSRLSFTSGSYNRQAN